MTAIGKSVLASFVLALFGCGNYSNEDLEFMSALPHREDVTVEVPQQASSLSIGAADGWKDTFKTTTTFNQTADAFLALIEKIRSYYPTARDANTRIWGPFPAEANPGWQIEFRMTKTSTTELPQYTYELVLIPPAGVSLTTGASSTTVIAGSFDASGGVRIGTGHFQLTVVEARDAGFVFDGLDRLQRLTIDYETASWPRQVRMTLLYDPPVTPLDVANAAYTYKRFENGDGQMTFTLPKEINGQVDTLRIASRWLGTWEGREDISITAGPEQGASSLECWDRSFKQTFKLTSWAPVGAPGSPPAGTGDPSTCIPPS